MSDLLVRLLAVLAGCALAIQPPVNARLRATLGDPIWAAFVSFLVGIVGLVVLAAALRSPFPPLGSTLRALPWWAWTGGLLGVLYVALALVVVPRIGSAALLSLVVLGMMLAALTLDHTGALGVTVRHVSLPRVLGAACVVAGVVLISRF